MKRSRNQTGFTLIELMVYLGITTIAITVFASFSANVSSYATRSMISKEGRESGRLILERLTKDIRDAQLVTPIPPPSSDHISLKNSTGTNVTYAWDAGNKTVTYNDGTLSTLSSGHVRVTNLQFTEDVTTHAIAINLTIEQENPTAPPMQQSSIQLSSTIVPRLSIYQ